MWFPALLYGTVIPNCSGQLAELIVYIIPPEWICIVTKARASKKYFRPPYLFQNKINLCFTLGIIMISTYIFSCNSYMLQKKNAQNKWKVPEKNTKLAWIFFFIPLYHFQLWGLEMPCCNITPHQWCAYWAWVKTSYIIQLNWLYLNYNLVALSPSEAPVASEIARELGWFLISQDANTAQKFP